MPTTMMVLKDHLLSLFLNLKNHHSRTHHHPHPRRGQSASDERGENSNAASVRVTMNVTSSGSQSQCSVAPNVGEVVGLSNFATAGCKLYLYVSSGHPTCVDIKSHSAEIARRYPWMCIECKPCEICREKGDDVRSFLCSFLDGTITDFVDQTVIL